VKHELNQQIWAVHSKPTATSMMHSRTYLDPNILSMQKPIEGGRPRPTYLEPIRGSMHYPKRGRSVLPFSAAISMLNFSALSKGRGVTQEQTTPPKPNTKPLINTGAALPNSSSFRNSSAFFTINHNKQKVESCMRQKNRQCLEILFAAWSSTKTPLNSKSPTTAKHTTSAVSHAKKNSRGTPQNSSNKQLKIKKEGNNLLLSPT
jgi:hypothetical protein